MLLATESEVKGAIDVQPPILADLNRTLNREVGGTNTCLGFVWIKALDFPDVTSGDDIRLVPADELDQRRL